MTPRPIKKEEQNNHVALVQWADYTRLPEAVGLDGMIGDYLMHPANGEMRDSREGAKLKRMGVRPGYPDLVLDIPASGYVGMRIELKARGAYPRPVQRAWHDRLRAAGFRVEVHREWTEAAEAIMRYLKGECGETDAA